MPRIPGTTERPWYAREAWPSIVGGSAAAIAGLAAIVKETKASNSNAYLIALFVLGTVGAASAGVFNTLRARYRDAEEDKKDSPDDFRACLHAILSITRYYKGVSTPTDGWMRITVHRVDGHELEQIIDYVGSSDGGASRRLPLNVGLIGIVARSRPLQSRVFERPSTMSNREWVDYLVRDGKMSRLKALQARQDRFSFLAVPIPDPGGRLCAVVYADAAQPGFFDAQTQSIFLHGCAGLAQWMNERYFS